MAVSHRRVDPESEAHKLQILAQARRVVDVIAEQEATAADAPLTVKCSMGQPVISPVITKTGHHARCWRSFWRG